MKVINMKCPNCQGSLDIKEGQKGGVTVCPFCGTKFFLEEDQPDINQTINIKEVHIGDTGKRRHYTKSTSTAFLPFVIILVIISTVFFLSRLHFFSTANMFDNDGSVNTNRKNTSFRSVPEDPAVIEFVSTVFGKPVNEITKDDYASIKYLSIKRKNTNSITDSSDLPWIFRWAKKIDERGNPVDPETVTVKGTENIIEDDIQAFTSLEALNFNNESDIKPASEYDYTDFSNLEKLRYYTGTGRETITSIADSLYNPAEIYELGSIYAGHEEDLSSLKKFSGLKFIDFYSLSKDFAKDLSFLSAFTDLEEIRLGFSNGQTWDLSGLSSLTKLKSLSISGFDTKFEHLNVLSGMPGLTEVSFSDVKDLKNLDFVKNMPNLKKLSIDNCPILTLDGLKGSLSLTELTLDGCRDLNDVSALATLVSLKKLNIAYIWNFDIKIPSLKKLTALSDVEISAISLEAVSDMPSIKKLFIYEVGGDYSFKPLKGMKDLTELELRSYTWAAKPDMVQYLSKLPKLKSLSFGYGCLANTGDFSDVFSLPQVTKLTITPEISNSSYLDISISKLKDNEVLEELDTGGVEICNLDMRDTSIAPLGEYNEFLEHFPKLKKLNVASSHIQSLDFTANMPQLEELDISNNYVSDVSPLLNLSKLKKLVCTGNQIANLDLLPKTVEVTD